MPDNEETNAELSSLYTSVYYLGYVFCLQLWYMKTLQSSRGAIIYYIQTLIPNETPAVYQVVTFASTNAEYFDFWCSIFPML